MLEAGEDPLYIARRVVRMAVEDIGLAEPNALALCMAARDAVDFIGMPEGNLALAQAIVYLCAAPKSNALYTAYGAVLQDVEQTAAEPVPLHLRNAPTGLMKDLGYGKGYQYAHDVEEKVADMQCLPDSLRDRIYYHPTNEGVEKRIRERLEEIKRIKTAPSHEQKENPKADRSQSDLQRTTRHFPCSGGSSSWPRLPAPDFDIVQSIFASKPRHPEDRGAGSSAEVRATDHLDPQPRRNHRSSCGRSFRFSRLRRDQPLSART